MAYQILFSDLDGTLINSGKALSGANIRAAEKALAAGKKIIINSGRSWHSLVFFEKQMGLNRPGNYGCGFNGGVVYEYLSSDGAERKVLSENVLTNARGLEIAASLKKRGADVLIYTLDELFAERETASFRTKEYSDTSRIDIHMVDDFSEISGGIIKILAQGDLPELQRLQREMAPECGEEVYMVFSCPWLLEFGPPAANKGNSVKFLADMLNVPLSEIIAMGDEENDITMLQTAGLGVAVGNATKEAKAAAKVVLPYTNDEDAFARVVEEYLLGEKF